MCVHRVRVWLVSLATRAWWERMGSRVQRERRETQDAKVPTEHRYGLTDNLSVL